MESKIPVILLCTALYGGQAFAACDTNTALDAAAISTAFSGQAVSFNCINDCESWMGDTLVDWHELHQGSGTLKEIGTGSDGIQPSKDVGSWAVAGDRISYTYTGDGTYSYTVHPIGGSSYEFCLGGTTHKATGTID